MRPLTLALLGWGWFVPALAFADPPSIDSLLRQLRSSDSLERRAAVKPLAADPKLPPYAAPYLVEALKDWRLRHKASQALTKIGPPAVPALLRALPNKETTYFDPPQRAAAIQILARLGPDAVPALMKAAKDRHPLVRQGAVEALGAIEPPGDRALPLLVSILQTPEPRLLLPDISGFIDYGVRLDLEIDDDPHHTRRDAAYALARYKSKGLARLLDALALDRADFPIGLFLNWRALIQEIRSSGMGNELLHNPERFLNWWKNDGPKLRAYLLDPHRSTRFLALQGLRQCGSDPPRGYGGVKLNAEETRRVLPAVAKALKDPDVHVRLEAAEFLRDLGEDATAAIPALVEALADRGYVSPRPVGLQSRSSLQIYAARALCDIGPAGLEALASKGIPLLAASLEDPNGLVRGYAAEALGVLGKKGQAALPALLKLVQEDLRREKDFAEQQKKQRQPELALGQRISESQGGARIALKHIGLDGAPWPIVIALAQEYADQVKNAWWVTCIARQLKSLLSSGF